MSALFDKLQLRVTRLLAAKAPDRMNVLRMTDVSDDGGGTRASWQPVNTEPIPCLVSPEDGDERSEGDRIVMVGDHKITVNAAVDVKAEDRIEVLPRGILARREFEVVLPNQYMGVVLEIKARLVL